MGTGIAHVLALAGYDVMLDDLNKDALGKALDRIEKNMQRQAGKGAIEESAIAPALARIRTTQSMDDLMDRDRDRARHPARVLVLASSTAPLHRTPIPARPGCTA